MRNVEDIYALSPMQELMLFHARTATDAHDVLFNQIVYELRGALDVTAYRRAWQLMVERHAALRTIFVWQDGKDPLQVVREQATLPWQEYDWRALAAAEQESKLDDLLEADRAQGFDLLRAPLMRMCLIRLTQDDYRLVWSSHHLIIDRWCIGILFAEVSHAYEAYQGNQYPALLPAPRYRDYIAWLGKQSVDEARNYWREALRNMQARPLALEAASADEAIDLRRIEVDLQGDEWTALRQFALQSNVTISTLVAGAWALVLSAATGAGDALFGLTVSGRPAELPEVGRIVGCFINNVPLRVPLGEGQQFRSWLEALQDQQLTLQSFEYASLSQIQAWSGIQLQGPLFETLLVLQAPVETAAPADVDMHFLRGGLQTGYPITLGAMPDRKSLRLVLTHDRQRVPQTLIAQMAASLPSILLAMPADQGALLGDIVERAEIDALLEQVAVAPVNGRHGGLAVSAGATGQQTLVGIWAEVLGLQRIDLSDRFFELGGDSIKALQLMTLVEERIGKELPISLLFGDPSLSEMAEALGEEVGLPVEDPVLVPINLEGTRPPVFFTHGVYGGLLWVKNVVPLLDPEQPIYGLRAIGLQAGVEPDYVMEEMAVRYATAMRRVQPTGPYHLGGFCFGGVLAYEVARQLERMGEETALLAIIDGFPPGMFYEKRPIYDPLRLQVIRESAPYWVKEYKTVVGGWIKESVLSRFGSAGGGQRDLEMAAAQGETFGNFGAYIASRGDRQYEITKINERAADNYVPQGYGGHVTLFRAQRVGVRHALFGPVDPKRGWGALAKGGVTVRTVEGTHVGLLTDPYVSDLAQQFNDELRKAILERS